MRPRAEFAFLIACVAVASCSAGMLHRSDFEGLRLSAVVAVAPDPIIRNDLLAARGIYPFSHRRNLASGATAMEVEHVRRLDEMLEAASRRVDFAATIARASLVAGSESLGAERVADPGAADYLLDLRIYEYGLHMRSYESEANFYLEGELLIRRGATGPVVWKRRVQRTGNISTQLTASEMAHLDERALEERLRRFAALAAARAVDTLSRSIRS